MAFRSDLPICNTLAFRYDTDMESMATRSASERKEMGFAICKNDRSGQLEATPVESGEGKYVAITNQCPLGTRLAGVVHTHVGQFPTSLSALDILMAIKHKMDFMCALGVDKTGEYVGLWCHEGFKESIDDGRLTEGVVSEIIASVRETDDPMSLTRQEHASVAEVVSMSGLSKTCSLALKQPRLKLKRK